MEYNKSDLSNYLFSQGKTLNEIRNLTKSYKDKPIEKEKRWKKDDILFCLQQRYIKWVL